MAGVAERAAAKVPYTFGFMSGKRVLGIEVEERGARALLMGASVATAVLHSLRGFRGGSRRRGTMIALCQPLESGRADCPFHEPRYAN